MKAMRLVVVLLFLCSMPVFVIGCGGANLNNPKVFEDKDSPEEEEMRKEMEEDMKGID